MTKMYQESEEHLAEGRNHHPNISFKEIHKFQPCSNQQQ